MFGSRRFQFFNQSNAEYRPVTAAEAHSAHIPALREPYASYDELVPGYSAHQARETLARLASFYSYVMELIRVLTLVQN